MYLYKEEVMDHYNHPRNQGKLLGDDVLHGKENNANCGDVVEFYLKVKQGKIVEVKWEGAGCAIMTASASKLSEWLKGQIVKEVEQLEEEQLVVEGVGIEVNPGRQKCVLIPVLALKKLLRN